MSYNSALWNSLNQLMDELKGLKILSLFHVKINPPGGLVIDACIVISEKKTDKKKLIKRKLKREGIDTHIPTRFSRRLAHKK
jgi:hypothetical protein